jgi:hypothetical protein
MHKDVDNGIAAAPVSNEGLFTFAPISTISASVDRKPLHLLTATDTPPSVAGFLTVMQTGMTRAAGQIGAGLHWFAFDAGFRACGSGELSIPYDGEVYTYEAPIPGCPKN